MINKHPLGSAIIHEILRPLQWMNWSCTDLCPILKNMQKEKRGWLGWLIYNPPLIAKHTNIKLVPPRSTQNGPAFREMVGWVGLVTSFMVAASGSCHKPVDNFENQNMITMNPFFGTTENNLGKLCFWLFLLFWFILIPFFSVGTLEDCLHHEFKFQIHLWEQWPHKRINRLHLPSSQDGWSSRFCK